MDENSKIYYTGTRNSTSIDVKDNVTTTWSGQAIYVLFNRAAIVSNRYSVPSGRRWWALKTRKPCKGATSEGSLIFPV